jgi:hypothetical protein
MVFRCCICLLLGLLVERLDFSIEEEAVCLDFGRVLEASGVVERERERERERFWKF